MPVDRTDIHANLIGQGGNADPRRTPCSDIIRLAVSRISSTVRSPPASTPVHLRPTSHAANPNRPGRWMADGTHRWMQQRQRVLRRPVDPPATPGPPLTSSIWMTRLTQLSTANALDYSPREYRCSLRFERQRAKVSYRERGRRSGTEHPGACRRERDLSPDRCPPTR